MTSALKAGWPWHCGQCLHLRRKPRGGLLDAIRGAVPVGPATRLTADDLYGSWPQPLITVTFGRDGVATLATSAGRLWTGRWAIDANERLVTDASGRMQPIDAWLDRDH
jgi:hypothetical protein